MATEAGIRFRIDATAARRGAAEVRGAFRSITTAARRDMGIARRSTATLATGFNRVKASVLSLRSAMITLGVVAIGRKFVGEFAEFERGLIGVGKTTGLEGAKLAVLGEGIQDLSERIPVATSRLLELTEAAGQLGITGSGNLLKFTETMGKLELATDLAGAEGAKTIARILKLTGTAVSQVDRFGSTITLLGNKTAASEREIAESAINIAQGIGTLFDVAAKDVLGLAAALTGLGVQPEMTRTALQTTFAAIEKTIREGGQEMQRLEEVTGKTAQAIRQQWDKSNFSVFEDFIAGLFRMREAGIEIIPVLEEFGLANRRNLAVIGTLASRFPEFAKSMALARGEWSANIALTKEAIEASKSFTAQMQLVRNVIDRAAADIGRELAPVILDLTTDFKAWVTELRRTGELERYAKVMGGAFRQAVSGVAEAFKFVNEHATFFKNTLIVLIGLNVVSWIGRVKLGVDALTASFVRLGSLSVLRFLMAHPALLAAGGVAALGATAVGVARSQRGREFFSRGGISEFQQFDRGLRSGESILETVLGPIPLRGTPEFTKWQADIGMSESALFETWMQMRRANIAAAARDALLNAPQFVGPLRPGELSPDDFVGPPLPQGFERAVTTPKIDDPAAAALKTFEKIKRFLKLDDETATRWDELRKVMLGYQDPLDMFLQRKDDLQRMFDAGVFEDYPKAFEAMLQETNDAIAQFQDKWTVLQDKFGFDDATIARFQELEGTFEDFRPLVDRLLERKSDLQAMFDAGLFAEFPRAFDAMMEDVENKLDEMHTSTLAGQDAWAAGMERGFKRWAEAAGDTASQVERATVDSLDAMSQSLTNFVVRGREDFGKLAQDIIANLIRIRIQAMLTPFFDQVFSAFASSFGPALAPDVAGHTTGGNPNVPIAPGPFNQQTIDLSSLTPGGQKSLALQAPQLPRLQVETPMLSVDTPGTLTLDVPKFPMIELEEPRGFEALTQSLRDFRFPESPLPEFGIGQLPKLGVEKFGALALELPQFPTLALDMPDLPRLEVGRLDPLAVDMPKLRPMPQLPPVPAQAAGQAAPQVNLSITTPPDTEARVEERTRPDGGLDLDVIIEAITGSMAEDIGRGGGLSPVLEQRYGLDRAKGNVR